MEIENLQDKKEQYEQFFKWLFDDSNIQLSSEIDFSLCPTYFDPNIYFPKPIEDFFNTKAMQRLGHISQLGLAISNNPNLYHTRLEHSKGVYNRKVEELFYNYQNPIWKRKIEKSNFKIYLIAELIKSAGHDMGHFPFSHAFEEQIIGTRGFHEQITRKLMYEDPEIQNILNSINPDLPKIIKDVFDEKISNFNEHDASSYDNDRNDYLQRDTLYSGEHIPIFTQDYTTYRVILDKNGNPKKNPDGSIKFRNNYSINSGPTIDVYENTSLNEILKTLKLRKKQYATIYMAPDTIYIESSIGCFLKAFMASKSNYGKELKDYLNHLLNNTDINKIDLEEIKKWDEVKVYSSLIDIAENHEDQNIRDLAAMIIPPMPGFLNLINSFINVTNTDKKSYSGDQLKLLNQIKDLLTSKEPNKLALLKKLRNNNFQRHNTILVPSKANSKAHLENIPPELISSFYCKNTSYKLKEPIYVKSKDGKVYELSTHPEVNKKELLEPEIHKQSFLNIPYLRFNGIPEEEILKVHQTYPHPIKLKSKKQNFNLSPVQVSHHIEDDFIK